MTERRYSINDDGEICEWDSPISREKILKLLNEHEFDIDDLRSERSRNEMLKHQKFYYSTRCLKLENGIHDCVHGHDDLRKFAKRMGVI